MISSRFYVQFPVYCLAGKQCGGLVTFGSKEDTVIPLFTDEDSLSTYLERSGLHDEFEGELLREPNDLRRLLEGAPESDMRVVWDPIVRDDRRLGYCTTPISRVLDHLQDDLVSG